MQMIRTLVLMPFQEWAENKATEETCKNKSLNKGQLTIFRMIAASTSSSSPAISAASSALFLSDTRLSINK